MAKKAKISKGKKSPKGPIGKRSSRGHIKLGQDVWPLERDVLFRPDRLKYVRKLIPDDGCVFCRAAEGGNSPETLSVYRTKHSMIVLNKYPYNSGHVLILPIRHVGVIFDLTDSEFSDLHLTQRLAMKALNEVYQPSGINVGLNHGRVSGAGIPDHLHYHVIPRWAGDLNFFPLIAETKVVVESLEQTYERLKNFFDLNRELVP